MKTIRIMALPILLAAHGLAWGGWDEGVAAYNRGDYDAALREWRPLAEHGAMYGNGHGVPQDDKETVKWFRKAAEQGHTKAQFNLGAMYGNGQGVPRDDEAAVKWYRRAAEQGNDRAQYSLGLMYINGQGIQQDHKKAMKWFRKAAEQGFASAQFDLGIMYHNGEGVSQNYVQAFKWFNIAGANGNEGGTNNRGLVAIKMTPAQVAEAKKLAREWMETHQ